MLSWNQTILGELGQHQEHDDVIKWKHFPRYWPFVREIHRSPVNVRHKGQWSGASMFFLSRAWINSWVNNHEPGDLRHHRAHYDIIVMTANALIPYVRRSAAATVATMQGKWDPFFHKKIILSFCAISVLTTDKNVIVCLCFLMKISATNFKTHDSTWMNIIILAWTSLWNLNPIAS